MKIEKILGILVVLSLMLSLMPLQQMANAASLKVNSPDLYFTEYIEGSSNNKALEIYNNTGADIDLAAGGYNVAMYMNGAVAIGVQINLTGTVAQGSVFVLSHASAVTAILAKAQQTDSQNWYNGDDAVVLRKGTTVVDVIGQVGFDPGTEWGTGFISTADNTIRRKFTVTQGDAIGSDVFVPAAEWEGYPVDTFDGLGTLLDTAPSVTDVKPPLGALSVLVSSNVLVTFSEPVNLTGSWFTLTCTTSGAHTASVTGSGNFYTLNPDVDFVLDETCTLTVIAAQVNDVDTIDPPDLMLADYTTTFSTSNACLAADYTHIYQIQGSAATAAVTGIVGTRGIVVGDYETNTPTGAMGGFYLQDAAGDSNASTSDGIFVYNGTSANSVVVGDDVWVMGTAEEYQGQTQISSVYTIIKCGTGTVTPVEVTLPLASADFLERYEGMLVTLPQKLYVTEHYQLGRFGQVVMSSTQRLNQPTNVALPGAPALAVQAANNLNRIIVDDALNNQNPDPILFGRGGSPLSAANTLRSGDTATGIVGVMSYTWGGNAASPNAYRVRPVNALGGGVPNFIADNPRPAVPPVITGTLKVVGTNLLNYFNTFDGLPDNVDNCKNGVGGAATDCRGADTSAEFDRQWPKTVAAIVGMDADVIGITEVENDGYGPTSAIQDLVTKLNAATTPGTYAFIDADANTGQINALGTDAIKVGFLYKPAKVVPVGITAALNTGAFGQFTITSGTTGRNRPVLAQTFQQISGGKGTRFTVAVNHLKSKGSGCDDNISPVGPDLDLGDGQGTCNLTRKQAAAELVAWLATHPTGIADDDFLIVGDMNSYALEDPITAIKNAGYTDLINSFVGTNAYSYVFDGQWGYLDHALGSTSLTPQVASVAEWHMDADEPSVLDYNTDFKIAGQLISLYNADAYRMADHDPIMIGLNLVHSPLSVTPGSTSYRVNQGASVMVSAAGVDSEGHTLSYSWDLNNNGIFETYGQTVSYRAGFIPGSYTINLKATDDFGNSAVASATVVVNNRYLFPFISQQTTLAR